MGVCYGGCCQVSLVDLNAGNTTYRRKINRATKSVTRNARRAYHVHVRQFLKLTSDTARVSLEKPLFAANTLCVRTMIHDAIDLFHYYHQYIRSTHTRR